MPEPHGPPTLAPVPAAPAEMSGTAAPPAPDAAEKRKEKSLKHAVRCDGLCALATKHQLNGLFAACGQVKQIHLFKEPCVPPSLPSAAPPLPPPPSSAPPQRHPSSECAAGHHRICRVWLALRRGGGPAHQGADVPGPVRRGRPRPPPPAWAHPHPHPIARAAPLPSRRRGASRTISRPPSRIRAATSSSSRCSVRNTTQQPPPPPRR